MSTDKPRWTNAVEKFVGFVGGTVNLTCSALAEPGAQFTWIKNNNTLHNNEFVKISNSDHHSALEVCLTKYHSEVYSSVGITI